MKVKKAIIPAGGYGTRFLPATKSVPKEMFPMGDAPIIFHVVDELVRSGIKEIIIVVSHEKHSISEFFSTNEMKEKLFLSRGKRSAVKRMRDIVKMAKFSFVYTREPFGNGGCLLAAEHFVKNEPFVVVWADEMFLTDGARPRVEQCLEVYEKYEMPVISAVRIENPEDRSRYGMARLLPFNGEGHIKLIDEIIEKPKLGTEPSVYATHGAYIMTPDFFTALRKTKNGKGGELWLADAINTLKKKHQILACEIEEGRYLDCGVPDAYFFSSIEYALSTCDGRERKDLKKQIKKLLRRY